MSKAKKTAYSILNKSKNVTITKRRYVTNFIHNYRKKLARFIKFYLKFGKKGSKYLFKQYQSSPRLYLSNLRSYTILKKLIPSGCKPFHAAKHIKYLFKAAKKSNK